MFNIPSILSECGAMLKGHFLLSSGKHSSQYFQCARLLQYPDKAAQVLATTVAKLLEQKKHGAIDFDCVIGPAMGGIIVAYELGRQLELPAFFTERDDEGNMTLRRGFEITSGQKILIAEDVITTGKSTLEAARCIEALGGIIEASVCVVDRRPENAENPFTWPIFSALRESVIVWDESSCPLCREGKLPPIKPGSRR